MNFSIILLFVSFLAGITTVFAPCIFTFLPIVLGASNATGSRNYRKAIIIITGLAVSTFIFTLLLRASTTLIMVPPTFWEIVAGGIIFIQGIFLLFPELWDRISLRLGFTSRANVAMQQAGQRSGLLGDLLTGAALGPIFSSCSPTYGFIVGTVIAEQANLAAGVLYLIIYILGLSMMLLLIALVGQSLVHRLKWGLNPQGSFKRIVALVFILLGWSIMFGIHRELEAFIIQSLPFLDITQLDRIILRQVL